MKTTGTCDQREPGESFTVQMLPVCCMLRSHSHCFPAQSSRWDAHTDTQNTSLFNSAPGEAWNEKMSVWRKDWNKMQNWERGRGKLSADQKHQSCYVATPAYVSTWSERCDGVCGGYWGCFLHASWFFFLCVWEESQPESSLGFSTHD